MQRESNKQFVGGAVKQSQYGSGGRVKALIASKMREGKGYLVQTAGDNKVCKKCQSLSGKFLQTGQRPPFHPNCRCSE